MPLPQAMQMLAKTGKAARRIRQVTEMPPTIIQPVHALPLPGCYDLQLNDVSFRYSISRTGAEKYQPDYPAGSKLPSSALVARVRHVIASVNAILRSEQGSVLLAGQD